MCVYTYRSMHPYKSISIYIGLSIYLPISISIDLYLYICTCISASMYLYVIYTSMGRAQSRRSRHTACGEVAIATPSVGFIAKCANSRISFTSTSARSATPPAVLFGVGTATLELRWTPASPPAVLVDVVVLAPPELRVAPCPPPVLAATARPPPVLAVTARPPPVLLATVTPGADSASSASPSPSVLEPSKVPHPCRADSAPRKPSSSSSS